MNFFEFLEQKFFKGESFYADNKIKTGFFDIYLLGKIIKHVIDQGYSNRLFQVTSSDHMTRYEFACLVAEILGKDPKLISKKNSKFPFNEDKIFTVDFTGVGNFTMNASNLEVTAGIKLPSIKEMLLSYFKILGIEDGKKAGKAAGSGGISYI
jgi:dTDP-4-dehydrorhamnose reductase